MLVVGLDTVFFYHLPMFMSPHDYQVILEGTFAQKGSDPQRAYRDDRTSNVKTRVVYLRTRGVRAPRAVSARAPAQDDHG